MQAKAVHTRSHSPNSLGQPNPKPASASTVGAGAAPPPPPCQTAESFQAGIISPRPPPPLFFAHYPFPEHRFLPHSSSRILCLLFVSDSRLSSADPYRYLLSIMSAPSAAMSALRSRVAFKQIHITMNPTPRNLTESRLVLQALQKFGEVVTFRNLKVCW